LLIFNC